MRNIKLLDGTVYQVDRAGAADGYLRLRLLPPWDLKKAVKKFSDPKLLDKIEHYFDGTGTDHVFFDHYTQFCSLLIDGDKLLIVLKEAKDT